MLFYFFFSPSGKAMLFLAALTKLPGGYAAIRAGGIAARKY